MPSKTHCHFCGRPLITRHLEGRPRLFCPNCRQVIYENPIPATCLIVADNDGRLLLVKRSVSPHIGQWCLPGGFIELDEMPDVGALRELKEETGLTGTVDRLLGARTTGSPLYHSVLILCYVVRRFSGGLRPGDDAAAVQWFRLDQCPELAFESHRLFLDTFIRQSTTTREAGGLNFRP